MFSKKRKIDDEDEKGADAEIRNTVSNPIPRQFKENSIVLHFTNRTWETVTPGELSYLPLCQTPYYMLNQADKNKLASFKDITVTWELLDVNAKISNLIMLQDDLTSQGGTPIETTAFTQSCYMIHFTPTFEENYFRLAKRLTCDTSEPMYYDMSKVQTCDKDLRSLVTVSGYSNFEQLLLYPSKVGINAGPTYHHLVEWKTDTTKFDPEKPYMSLAAPGSLSEYSVNLSATLAPVHNMNTHTTYARNMDTIEFLKYGDTKDLEIVTNLGPGKEIIYTKETFLDSRESIQKLKIDETTEITMQVYDEFIYPGRARGYLSRNSLLEPIGLVDHSRDLKPLRHHFFSMPPINKASNALLKQRCNFLLEQSFVVRLNFPETIYGRNDNVLNAQFQLERDNAIGIKRAMYGNFKEKPDKTYVSVDRSTHLFFS